MYGDGNGNIQSDCKMQRRLQFRACDLITTGVKLVWTKNLYYYGLFPTDIV